MKRVVLRLVLFLALLLSACQSAGTPPAAAGDGLKVLAVESFLADITRNVAGDRASVDTLVPLGLDPHAFEPAPQDVARLVDQIRASGVHAIFLEVGSNPQLAQQVSGETGVKVVTDIYTHSITPPNGPAPTYIDMMKVDVNSIVQALR